MEPKPKKSRRLVSIEEFLAGKNLSRVFIAGFRKYVKTQFLASEEWTALLEEYKNR